MNPYLPVVQKWYPNAQTTIDIVNALFDLLKQKYGLDANQIMAADSLCCDDVNAIQYPPRAYEMLGPFKMGGLNGYPFAGVTGMNAFAHHVPLDGAVLVFYAPHIGITKEGSIGEINRIGQADPSSCCGAAQGALGKLLKGDIEPGKTSELDYQMNTIEQLFLQHEARIKNAQTPIFEATEVMYEAIEARIEQLVERTDYPCQYIFLVGGIFINGDRDMGSYCSFKTFDVIDLNAGSRSGLMESFQRFI